MAHHHHDLPPQRSNPLLWTGGIVFFLLVTAFWLGYQYGQGTQHARNNPYEVVADDSGTTVTIPDHAALIGGLDDAALKAGRTVFNANCTTCHGADGVNVVLAGSRAFANEAFKYGNDPYSMYVTIIEGNGQMPAQRLSPEDTYAAIHYIRETWQKPKAEELYFSVTDDYLASGEWPAPGVAAGVDAEPGYVLKAKALEVPVAGVLATWADSTNSVANDRAKLAAAARTLSGTPIADSLAAVAAGSGNDGTVQALVSAAAKDDPADFVAAVSAIGGNIGLAGLATLNADDLQLIQAVITGAQPAVAPAAADDHSKEIH